ncbi:pseudouridine synthase [Sphingobacterium sp. UBA7249]|uniref:pseudouridine synthase n=2 Tax=unclassified Sphingobacterium TaxID=2609468 RepID=UPI0025E9CEF9|nr:pseudouridine synthase [Sphingobacterium sp. UBA7249]
MPFSNKRNSRDDNSRKSRGNSDSFKSRGDKNNSFGKKSSFGSKDQSERGSFRKDDNRENRSFGSNKYADKPSFRGESNSFRSKDNSDKPFNKTGRSFDKNDSSRSFDRKEGSFDKRDSFKRSDRSDSSRSFDRKEGSFDKRDSFKRSDRSDSSRSFDRKEGSFDKRDNFKRSDRSDSSRSFDRKEGSFDKRDSFKRSDRSDSSRSFDRKEGSFDKRDSFKRSDRSDSSRSFDRKEGSFDKRDSFKRFDRSDSSRSFDKKEGSFDKRDSYKRFDKDERPSSGRSRSFDKPSNRKFDGDRSRSFDENKSFDDKQYSKRPKKKAETSTEDDGLIRLNRYIANAGICSRRKADELIAAGVIWVNGEPVSELGTKVDPATDEIRYNNERLKREKMVYVLLNKPKDYITTTDDPQERHTVMELVSKATKERIYPVGRLDRNTTGLLLMTNDGNLAEKLSHPRNSISKIYNIELNKSLTQGDFNKINFGIELEDGIIKPDDLSYVQGGSKREIGIQIHSGKNRIVRRIFESLGYEVVKLDRVVYANLTKKDLPRGRWRYLEEREIVQLKHLM